LEPQMTRIPAGLTTGFSPSKVLALDLNILTP
jgi:hypothetical protein